MLKATQTRTSHARFALLVSMALTAACGGATDSQTSGSSTPLAGSPATVVAGRSAAVAGSTGSAGAAPAQQGTAGAHAGTGGSTTGSAGAGAGAGGVTAAGAAGKSGAGAAGTSGSAAGAAGSSAGAVSFTAVYQALFTNTSAPGCFGCHGGIMNPALNGNFSMVTSKDVAYMGLVGAMSSDAGMCKGMTRVKAGDPMSSLLYLKIAGTPPCGMQMPPGDKVDAATVTLVKDWITAGAKND